MKPQSTLCQSLTHEILLWAIDLIVPFCRYTLLPTWGSSSNSLALACLALPRLLLQVTFFFMMFFCAWAASRHLRAHTEPAFSVTYKHACDMVLTLTWPRFGVRFDDLSDVLTPLSLCDPFFFFALVYFFASRDGRGTKNCCPRHGQLVLCRSSTIPLFQNQILNRPSSTGQKNYITSYRQRERGK